jgi:hypothetical protein
MATDRPINTESVLTWIVILVQLEVNHTQAMIIVQNRLDFTTKVL